MQQQKSFVNSDHPGTLYLVATPIGNLEDITFRAIHILKEVDVIAAEDTRHTRKLMTHFSIATPLMSYHEHNRGKQGELLVARLLQGEAVALVSDAGLPAVSDPGAELVREALNHDIAVVPIPGANAALSALIGSGMATERFLFLGFLPRERKACQQTLQQWRSIEATVLLYEAPHRLLATLRLIHSEWGNRRGAVVRELTKRHEQWLRGTVAELIDWFEQVTPRGECTLVFEGAAPGSMDQDSEAFPWWHALPLQEHVDYLIRTGASTRDAIKQVADERNIGKRDVYNHYHANLNDKEDLDDPSP